MSTATVDTTYVAASGRQVIGLTSWAGDAGFSPTPVSGGQLEGASSLTIDADGTINGDNGTYTLYYINTSGLIDSDSYVINVVTPTGQTASVVTTYEPPTGLTLTTLVEPIEHYVDQSWTAQAEAGEQVLFDSDDLTISENLNLSAELEGVYSYWYINNAGAVFNPTFTVQNLPAFDDGTDPVEPGYPSLTLTGGSVFAEAGTTWVDPGYTATDSVDGVITGDVQITGTVDTDTLGPVTLTYSVTNSQSNTTTKTRTVTVRDTIAPVITLTGGTVALAIGDTFTDPGYSALDSFEGDVTADMEVTGTVDTATDSTWLLVYTATDSSGNSSNRLRTVVVGTGGQDEDADSLVQPIARSISSNIQSNILRNIA